MNLQQQEEDIFFMDMRDLNSMLKRHRIGDIAHFLAHYDPTNAESLCYELTISIRQEKRRYGK